MKRILVSVGTILAIVIMSLVVFISKTYTDPFSKDELPKSEEKAKEATIKYFKEKKNLDIVIDKIGTIGELGPCRLFLEGHVVGNEKQKITATVQIKETKIVTVSGEISK
ncbi:MAG: hypothetical protein ACQEU4_05720 [Bacillota bacterium]